MSDHSYTDAANPFGALARLLCDGTESGFTAAVTGDGGHIESVRLASITTGYAVGGNPWSHETRIADIATAPVTFVADMLRFYAWTAHMHGQTAIGGWLHEGALYLDAPTIYVDGDEAVRVARERGEIALFHLDTGTEIFADSEAI